MKTLLVTHPWMGRGGSEATAMWTLMALQDEYEVTFVTASTMEWEELNIAYGTAVDPGRIHFIRAPRLPGVTGPARLVHAQLRYFEAFCQKLAQRFDHCLSAYHPIWFGRPGIQLIGDFSFSEAMRSRLYVHGEAPFVHRETLLRKLYLSLSRRVGSDAPPLSQRKDLVLANSQWTADQLRTYFSVSDAPILYPPVILPTAPEKADRDPLGFVCLGRVVPEKEVERIISILVRVRQKGYPVTLRLIGALDDTSYSRRIAEEIEKHQWITPEGFLTLAKKQAVLASQSFALHACRIEAFGIAVAEMASMGCVPLVPDTGGAGEIVGFPELQFREESDAVERIVALLESPRRVGELRETLVGSMERFGPETFMATLRDHVLRFSAFGGERGSTVSDGQQDDTHSPQDLAAIH